MVLEAFVGPCPPGEEACHGPAGQSNDSLANLSWGTRSKNQGADRVRDGISNRGERCGTAKLTAAIVIECRYRYAAGETQVTLAAEFGVDQSVISDAVRGVTWKDLDVPPVLKDHLPPRFNYARLTKEVVLECRRRYAAGETQISLALEFNISYDAMSNAIRGRTWSQLTKGILDPEIDGRSLTSTPEMRMRRREYGRQGAAKRWHNQGDRLPIRPVAQVRSFCSRSACQRPPAPGRDMAPGANWMIRSATSGGASRRGQSRCGMGGHVGMGGSGRRWDG